jgi:hypothetical protein
MHIPYVYSARRSSPTISSCRTIASDGEVARDVEILLIEDKDYTVLASAKTDAAGTYTFKAPAAEYHVVALGDKAHVASLSSVDIW